MTADKEVAILSGGCFSIGYQPGAYATGCPHPLLDAGNTVKIGITFDLKTPGQLPPGVPDDLQEEFDGPHTIEAIAQVLRDLGHGVVLLGDGREFLEKVLADPPDFVFNFAEGHGVSRSREARVPAVLEMLGIPFTGSDPLTMAVTLDKDCARRLVAAAGVRFRQGVRSHPAPPGGLRPAPDLAVSRHRQAGLGRFEQGHPQQMPGVNASRTARRHSFAVGRTIVNRF